MSDTEYVTDTTFDSRYVANQRPALLSYVAANAGYTPPVPSAPFTYLELGCGAGLTLNALAACYPQARFLGVDFNAEHIGAASNEAAAAGLENVTYREASFADIGADDLPKADYIAIQGTYSWLSPALMTAVHDIVRHTLADRGVFYIDFLSLPGKASIEPLWRLMRVLTANFEGSSVDRGRYGVELLAEIQFDGVKFLDEHPHARTGLNGWLRAVQENPSSARHFAHHALAKHWVPQYFDDVARDMAAIGLTFAGSAELRNNGLEILPSNIRKEVEALDDPWTAEVVKDFVLFQQQRNDIFVKSRDPDPDGARAYLEEHVYIALLQRPESCLSQLLNRDKSSPNRNEPLYRSHIQTIGTEARRYGEVFAAGSSLGETPKNVAATIERLISSPAAELYMGPLLSDDDKVDPPTAKYNAHRLDLTLETGRDVILACPVAGDCRTASKIEAIIVALLIQEKAKSVQDVLKHLGRFSFSVNIGGQDTMVSNLNERQIGPLFKRISETIIPRLSRLGGRI